MVAPANVVKDFGWRLWTGLEAEYICFAIWMLCLMDWNPQTAAATRLCVNGITKQNPSVRIYQNSASTGLVMISQERVPSVA